MKERSQSTILIVDDSPENLYCLNELLRPRYRILAANSGEECLRLAHGVNQPDLILLDVMMPGMDGFTVFKKLRAAEETKHIPVVFLTAMIQAKDEEYGLDLGAEDYITKPIRPLVVLALGAAGEGAQAERFHAGIDHYVIAMDAYRFTPRGTALN